MDDNKGDDTPNGKVLVFPGGKKMSPDDVGAPYVVTQSGQVPTPEPIDSSLVAEEFKEREAFVRKQALILALENGSSTSELIDAVLLDMAEETAHLKWERRQISKSGKPAANYNVARVNSLRSIAELLIKRKEAAIAERLDLKSPRFQKIFNLMMEFFHESMEKSGVTPEVIDLVFQQMKADMLDWEKLVDSVD